MVVTISHLSIIPFLNLTVIKQTPFVSIYMGHWSKRSCVNKPPISMWKLELVVPKPEHPGKYVSKKKSFI